MRPRMWDLTGTFVGKKKTEKRKESPFFFN